MTKNYTDLWVCRDCYTEHHYGSREADRSDGLTLFTRFPNGGQLSDNTCSDHNGSEDGKCDHCGQTGYENGVTEFSKVSCDGCGSHLAGSRDRLAYWPGSEVTK